MKATLDIPDELYRRVKARSALEGRPLRSVAVELFQNWLEPSSATPPAENRTIHEMSNTPWLAITRRHLKAGMSHDLDSIRSAISKGWADEEMARTKHADFK